MLPLRLIRCSSRLAGLQTLCNKSQFQQLAIIHSTLGRHLVVTNSYCTQVKKNDLAIKTVKSTEIIQEALEKKKQQLQEKRQQLHVRKLQIQENIRDTRTKLLEKQANIREKVEEVIERENIFTVPNALCLGRIIMSPYLGYVIVQGDFSVAMGLMVAAGLTDMADGYIARNWEGQMSKFGSFLDPLADKCLMGVLVGSLTYCNLMPLWLAATILSRDVFLIAAAFVIRYKSLPSSQRTFTSYFNATKVTAQLEPTFISKVNTGVQLFAVAASLGAPIWNYIDHSALHGLWYLTGATTLAAAISYIVKKDTYKYLRQEMKRK